MLEINNYLTHFFNDFLFISYYFLYFKELINFILCKLGNIKDYTNLKSYQFISLLNILGKVIIAIVATKISYLITIYYLLSKTQFKG